MSSGPHGPAELRAFLRRLKGHRGDPRPLLSAARALGDHARAAQALTAVAAHGQAPGTLRDEAIRLAAERLRQVTRETQVAEVVPLILKTLGPGSDARSAAPFVERLVALPDGEALSLGLREAAKHAPPSLRLTLFDRALHNPGYERDDAKAVLRVAFAAQEDLLSAGDWRTRIAAVEDAGLRIRLNAFLHHQLAQLSPRHLPTSQVVEDVVRDLAATVGQSDGRERVELWRAVVQSVSTSAALPPLIAALEAEPLEVRADVALALGAQADRLGEKEIARRLFDEVDPLLSDLEDAEAERIGRKLEAARGRLEGRPVEPKPRPPQRSAGGDRLQRLPPRSGHALALCNTYTGGVKAAHFRAVARAAPLCAAFGLDLVLIGFPVPLDELVERTARETRIGGHAWIRDLAGAGRVHSLPPDPAQDAAAWSARGTWIATSERADPGRYLSLEAAMEAGPVAVVMGVGPKGLPERLRRACSGEYEITGAGVGLETATAMGILADRMGRAAARGT